MFFPRFHLSILALVNSTAGESHLLNRSPYLVTSPFFPACISAAASENKERLNLIRTLLPLPPAFAAY